MGLLQYDEKKRFETEESSCIERIYNFIYRLSGNTEVAESLTEGVIFRHCDNRGDELFLLKQGWLDFFNCYQGNEFEGKEFIQRCLLQLAPEPRCALILRDVFGYSYRQIAFVLDKVEPVVVSLVSSGRREMTENNRILASL